MLPRPEKSLKASTGVWHKKPAASTETLNAEGTRIRLWYPLPASEEEKSLGITEIYYNTKHHLPREMHTQMWLITALSTPTDLWWGGVLKDSTWAIWFPGVFFFPPNKNCQVWLTRPGSSKFYCIWTHAMENFSHNILPDIHQVVFKGLNKWLAYRFSSQHKCLCQRTLAKSFPSKV